MLLQRCGLMGALLVAFLALGVADTRAQADPVRLSIGEQTYTFGGDAEIVVEIHLQNALGVAGIDFVISFPEERFLDMPTWESAGLFSLDVANETVPGQVTVSAILAEGLDVASGLVGTLTFMAPCLGNAQDWPEGRSVEFAFTEFLAFDEASAALGAEATGGAIVLNCTATPVDESSFGVLKARYDGR